jgi:Fe-Mn family superoxide dismutase
MGARIAKELKFTELQGLSKKQIDEHYNVLYKGYVNKLNEIELKLSQTDLDEANATYSIIRELKREEVFTANAIKLHEGYFDSLGGAGGKADSQILDLMEQDFGSYEDWEKEFKACGLCARGWVVLAFDWTDGKLHNYTLDIHSDGVWGVSPLLIMDVYEHAYFIDYATARKSYIDAFHKNINWAYVNSQVDQMGIMQRRMAA